MAFRRLFRVTETPEGITFGGGALFALVWGVVAYDRYVAPAVAKVIVNTTPFKPRAVIRNETKRGSPEYHMYTGSNYSGEEVAEWTRCTRAHAMETASFATGDTIETKFWSDAWKQAVESFTGRSTACTTIKGRYDDNQVYTESIDDKDGHRVIKHRIHVTGGPDYNIVAEHISTANKHAN